MSNSLPPNARLRPGLVSVSFRSWSVETVLAEAVAAGLEAIEWGGDVHVPHGDLVRAAAVRQATEAAGLRVAAYGSYYRVGSLDPATPAWESVLASAIALGAPLIRVWAGNLGSAQLQPADWDRIVADAARIGRSAAAAGVRVAFEYHDHVLTDELEPAQRLLARAAEPALCMYWQPQHHHPAAAGLVELRAFAPLLGNLHVFSWVGGWNDKRRLEIYEDRWPLYFQAALEAPALRSPTGEPLQRWALLEFIDDSTAAGLRRDAATLHRWLARSQA